MGTRQNATNPNPRVHVWAFVMLICAGLIGACTGNGGAVVFAPTPLPADLSPLTYTHPSGGFNISVPRTWSAYTQNTTELASASFTPPGQLSPVVTAIVGRVAYDGDLIDFVNRYQSDLRGDLSRYSEQDRQQMDDGSWRLTGLRETFAGEAEQLNTFIVQTEDLFGVVDMVVSADDPTRMQDLVQIVNTFRLDPTSELAETGLMTFTATARADLSIRDVRSWWTPSGVFFITGEVLNHTVQTLSGITVAAGLYDGADNGIASAIDTVMGYALHPGEFAPFALRFDQPAGAVRYVLELGAGEAVIGDVVTAPDLNWTNTPTRSQEGHLIVTGTVTNTGTSTVEDALVIITVFDDENGVVAAGFMPLETTTLDPRESAPYNIRVPEMGGEPADFLINIQARME